MELKHLYEEDMNQAITLKLDCWEEELAGKLVWPLKYQQELNFWKHWRHHEFEHNDKRTMLGYYQGRKLLATGFCSFADDVDGGHDAIEINGLWVAKDHRGQNLGSSLFYHLINQPAYGNCNHVILYNHHYAPSNAYYRKLNGVVIRQDLQCDGKMLVDVFQFEKDKLSALLLNMIKK